MHLATAVAIAIATVTSLAVSAARAEPPAPPPARPPPVIYLVEAVGEGNTVDLGVADVVAGTTRAVLDDLPLGVDTQLAVDAATRRWAITVRQQDGGAPLIVDGRTLTEPGGVAAVLVGQLGTPGVTILAGDPRCHSKRTACFETPLFFAARGQVLITRSEGNSWWMWNRRVVGAGARPVAIVDRRLTGVGHSLAVGSDGARAAYLGKRGGLYVTAWRPPATGPRPALVKAARTPVSAPPLVMSDLTLVGDHVFYFRRDPEDQHGVIAAWDLVRATEIEAFRLPEPAPLWQHRFLPAPARASVIFQHDVGFERADVVELSLTTWQVRTIAHDVREVLDVSADGRFVVAAAFADPDAATRTVFEQQLVVIDVELGREVARLALPARLAKLYDARFVSPPP